MAAIEINFTKKALDMLPKPEPGKRLEAYDSKTPGLLIRVTGQGTKTFTVYRRVNGQPQRVKLGHYPDMTIEQARKNAAKALSKMADGIDPVVEKRADKAKAVSLTTVLEAYIASHDLKPGTVKDYRRAISETFPDWLHKPLSDITKDMVERRHRERGKVSKARTNNAMRVLRALFYFAAGKYENADGTPMISDNPVKRLSATRTWYRVNRRQTVIKRHQLATWFAAVMGLQPKRSGSRADVVRVYLLTVLFTGLRREEAAQLTWPDIDLIDRTFTVVDTKNRDRHTLPLPDFLHDLIAAARDAAQSGSEYVFPGIGGSDYGSDVRYWNTKVMEACGVRFSQHDLRRTFTTVAESLDISLHALKRLLNHRISESDVTGGYIITDVERLRAPMRKIEIQLLRLVHAKPDAKIVALASA